MFNLRKKQNNEYKSPVAAFLWSVTMVGFGQLYNGQYTFGFMLLASEFTINTLSNLNPSIHHSFHGDFIKAHDVVNYHWGLFYPSLYGFSNWQAYNRAIVMNYQKEGKEPPEKVYLTGFCIGLVVGMNLGVYWHHYFLDHILLFKVLSSPVFNGIFLGIIVGFAGHLLEKLQSKLKVDEHGRKG